MGTSYSTLGNDIPFEEVVNYLRDYDEDGSTACLGYQIGEEDSKQIIEIPLDPEPAFDPKKTYVLFLRTKDVKKRNKKVLDTSVGRDKLMKLLGIDKVVRNGLYTRGLDMASGDLHSYVWPEFDEAGNLYGASRWGGNEVEWFTDGIGMYSEHSDEYQDFSDDGDDFEDDDEE